MRAGDRAPPAVGIGDHRLERLLAQPARREPRIAEYRAGAAPRLTQVQVRRRAEQESEQLPEVRRYGRVGKVVALALHDARGEARRRRESGVLGEEPRIADEDAADLRVLASSHRAIAGDLRPHLPQARRTVPAPTTTPGSTQAARPATGSAIWNGSTPG
jgi:hypothetical protein